MKKNISNTVITRTYPCYEKYTKNCSRILLAKFRLKMGVDDGNVRSAYKNRLKGIFGPHVVLLFRFI